MGNQIAANHEGRGSMKALSKLTVRVFLLLTAVAFTAAVLTLLFLALFLILFVQTEYRGHDEINTAVNLSHCGACSTPCTAANASR